MEAVHDLLFDNALADHSHGRVDREISGIIDFFSDRNPSADGFADK